MGAADTAFDAKWTTSITYAKDDASSSSKTLSYFYPDDKWGGFCTAAAGDNTICDGAMAELKYGQFSRGIYTTVGAAKKL